MQKLKENVGTSKALEVIKELPTKRQGRPLLLEETTDQAVQEYIKLFHSNGGTVNTCIVMAAAEAIISMRHPGYLQEQGGFIVVTRTWAKSLLIRMNFAKRKSSNAGKLLPVEFNLQKEHFLNDICAEVIMNNIPENLILNWDHTSIHLVPVSEWTMEKHGTKNIIVTGVDDKQQITLVLAATMTGCFCTHRFYMKGKLPDVIPQSNSQMAGMCHTQQIIGLMKEA